MSAVKIPVDSFSNIPLPPSREPPPAYREHDPCEPPPAYREPEPSITVFDDCKNTPPRGFGSFTQGRHYFAPVILTRQTPLPTASRTSTKFCTAFGGLCGSPVYEGEGSICYGCRYN